MKLEGHAQPGSHQRATYTCRASYRGGWPWVPPPPRNSKVITVRITCKQIHVCMYSYIGIAACQTVITTVTSTFEVNKIFVLIALKLGFVYDMRIFLHVWIVHKLPHWHLEVYTIQGFIQDFCWGACIECDVFKPHQPA